MCGRFSLTASPEELEAYFKMALNGLLVQPRYNIAPSQSVLGVRISPTTNSPEFTPFYWGFLPRWLSPEQRPSGWINARLETAGQLPVFRSAFKQRRCLIPTTGFFEWKSLTNRKQPYFIHYPENKLFAFGGIWEQGQDEEGNPRERVAILTMEPTVFISGIHNRMPVVIPPEHFASWLKPRMFPNFKEEIAVFKRAGQNLTAYPVSTHVNSPQHDDVQCINPVEYT